jgi:hypothetical protein
VVQQLILKRASASRFSGQWQEEDYDVLADGKAVGRIYEPRAGVAVGMVPHHHRAGDGGRDKRYG